jgi:hypothetical protein
MKEGGKGHGQKLLIAFGVLAAVILVARQPPAS